MPDFTVQRIVSLQPSATVILDAVGELSRVVACTRYCAEVCPAAGDGSRIIVADSWTAQAEQILVARPDLVIASVPYQEKAVIEILKSGVRFLGFAPKTLEDIYGDIMAIAGVVGAHERGAQVVSEMRSQIEAVRSRTTDLKNRPRVFCEEWGKPIIHSQSWVKELVEAAGGNFLGEPGKQTTSEQVRAANPEIIVTAWCGAGSRVPLEKIIREREWSQTSAAQSGKVFCISDELLNTPAPTLIGGLNAMVWAIHPEMVSAPSGIRCMAEIQKPLIRS